MLGNSKKKSAGPIVKSDRLVAATPANLARLRRRAKIVKDRSHAERRFQPICTSGTVGACPPGAEPFTISELARQIIHPRVEHSSLRFRWSWATEARLRSLQAGVQTPKVLEVVRDVAVL